MESLEPVSLFRKDVSPAVAGGVGGVETDGRRADAAAHRPASATPRLPWNCPLNSVTTSSKTEPLFTFLCHQRAKNC